MPPAVPLSQLENQKQQFQEGGARRHPQKWRSSASYQSTRQQKSLTRRAQAQHAVKTPPLPSH